MATIYIGCYHETESIVQATKILAEKQHKVEVFASYEGLLIKMSDGPPDVLLLPVFFKGPVLFIEVIDRTREQLRAHGCQVGMFAIMKEDGEPSVAWKQED